MLNMKGIVPKYLAIYSITKIIFIIKEFLNKEISIKINLDFIIAIGKIILSLTRILGLKYIHSEFWLNLTISSILLEPLLLLSNKAYFYKSRMALEIIISILSLICVTFFHPFYRNKEKKMI